MAKICCGGFNLGEGLELDGRTLKATGGSSPVPNPEAADIGKVLGIVEDGAGAKYAPVEGSGSGLPDPSSLSDGTAMVAVNGEWKMQEGYGYTGEPAFEPITWDGDTEGRDVITIGGVSLAYKVSDIVFTTDMLDGATSVTSTGFSGGVEIIDDITSFLFAVSLADSGFNLISGSAGEYSEMGGTVVIPSDGTYFTYSNGLYLTSLTAPASVHKFDSALIPSGDYTVTFSLDDDGETYACDKTLDEILANSNNAKFVLLLEGAILHATTEMVEPSLPLVYVEFNTLANNKLQNFVINYDDDAISGSSTSYTLTPDT